MVKAGEKENPSHPPPTHLGEKRQGANTEEKCLRSVSEVHPAQQRVEVINDEVREEQPSDADCS